MGRYPLHSDTVAGQYGFVFTIQTVGQLPVVMETNTNIQTPLAYGAVSQGI